MLQNRSRETQILSDLVGAAIYLATALAVVDVVFAVPVGGLIATSGVIAVVIGLALQSTLSDVFSGIAIDIERPYRAGDFVSVEGGVEGRVREVNWRSTLIATVKGDLAVVPNSVMAKARLVNHSLPVPVRRTSVEVRIDPRASCPIAAGRRSRPALQACRLPLADPAPAIAQTALRGDGADVRDRLFGLRRRIFSVRRARRSWARCSATCSMPRSRSPWRAWRTSRACRCRRPPTCWPDRTCSACWLRRSGPCSPRRWRPSISTRARTCSGRAMPRRRSTSSPPAPSAFCGANADGTERHFRVSPGTTLGAIGLITGSPYAAGATALTPVKAFRLGKAAITAAIAAQPSLTAALEELARRGQAAMIADISAATDPGETPPDLFLSRMRGFLQRLAVGISPGGLQ